MCYFMVISHDPPLLKEELYEFHDFCLWEFQALDLELLAIQMHYISHLGAITLAKFSMNCGETAMTAWE